LEWKEPPDGREVHGPRLEGASTLHQHHRLRSGSPSPSTPEASPAGAAAPRPPARGKGASLLHRATNAGTEADLQRRPAEHRQQGGIPPPQKATPTPPSPPQRRRQATILTLHYVHAGIR
jgi:hypothetical protein